MKSEKFAPKIFKTLYTPPPNSHKGQNGKVMMIGGSKLFHSGSIWPLEIASKIVDMVFYSSIDENNQIVKGKFQNGIVIPRNKLENYIDEADSILIGSGLPRKDGQEHEDDDTKSLTELLLSKYPHKKWVIDGGSLQVIESKSIPSGSILTPHQREFEKLFGVKPTPENAFEASKKYDCTILLKGPVDVVCSSERCVEVPGGNAGMTKGGTGDVLAGLVVALFAKNDAFLSALGGSYINKKAGENLFKRVGYYFNSSDLVSEIPLLLKDLLLPPQASSKDGKAAK